ncbi:hypothetical protein [Sinomonas atrocyanea]|uniref:hypothetical protein n=1 Tax=Sinomonas atrocyanea TaxID=37927 RepID=UPI003D9639B9
MPTTYTIHEGEPSGTPNIAAKGDGRHPLDLKVDGVQIYAIVKDGQIAGYEGERDGRPVETVTLHEVRQGPAGPGTSPTMRPVNCYVCICDDTCQCYPVDCPGGR